MQEGFEQAYTQCNGTIYNGAICNGAICNGAICTSTFYNGAATTYSFAGTSAPDRCGGAVTGSSASPVYLATPHA